MEDFVEEETYPFEPQRYHPIWGAFKQYKQIQQLRVAVKLRSKFAEKE